MKKTKDYTLLALFIPFSIAGLFNLPACYSTTKKHTCIDQSHNICDGKCSCDGMECPADKYYNAYQLINARDYQLEIVEDSIIVFDGNRHVGTIPMWDNSPLDSLIQIDNQ